MPPLTIASAIRRRGAPASWLLWHAASKTIFQRCSYTARVVGCRTAAATYFAGIAAAIKGAGAHLSTDVIAEKRTGDILNQFWFLLAFQHGISFVRCDMVKINNAWIVDGVDIQSDANKVGLP